MVTKRPAPAAKDILVAVRRGFFASLTSKFAIATEGAAGAKGPKSRLQLRIGPAGTQQAGRGGDFPARWGCLCLALRRDAVEARAQGDDFIVFAKADRIGFDRGYFPAADPFAVPRGDGFGVSLRLED